MTDYIYDTKKGNIKMEYVADGKDRIVSVSPEGTFSRDYKTPLIFKKAIELFTEREKKVADVKVEKRKEDEEVKTK